MFERATVRADSEGSNFGLAGAGQHPVISRAGQRGTHSGPVCVPVLSQPHDCPLESHSVCLLYIYQHNKYQPVWTEALALEIGMWSKNKYVNDVCVGCLLVLTSVCSIDTAGAVG